MEKTYIIDIDKLDKDPCPNCGLFAPEQELPCPRLEGTCFNKQWYDAQQSVLRNATEIKD